jgi:DNA-binding protein HU-beta
MNKRDLIDAVAATTGEPKNQVASMVDAVFGAITGALQGREKVQIAGFGNFEARFVKERTARNPQTGAAVQVPAHHAPRFKPAKALKDTVKGTVAAAPETPGFGSTSF